MLNSTLFRLFPGVLFCVACAVSGSLQGAERVFSGPQPGEKTTPFKVVDLTAASEGVERDLVSENKGAPTALVFLHGIERSLAPLLGAIDQYGVDRKDRLKSEIVFLSADRLAGEQRFKAAAKSLRLQSRLGISLDGAEGPGNYGLNKECLMTIVVARDNKVTANFALVQPGISDAPKVIEALAAACGDTTPPTVEALEARRREQGGGRGRNAMAGDPGMMRRGQTPPVDLATLDLNSEAGLRDAVKALTAEVQGLRREVAELRGNSPATAPATAAADKPKEGFPGKPPTDGKLMGLLRQFIRPANDDAAVDRVLKEVNEYVLNDAGLRQQAIDGWTRVLHFDHYGTAYARKQGQAAMEKWKQQK